MDLSSCWLVLVRLLSLAGFHLFSSFILFVNLFFNGKVWFAATFHYFCVPFISILKLFQLMNFMQMWCYVVFFTQTLFPKQEMDQGWKCSYVQPFPSKKFHITSWRTELRMSFQFRPLCTFWSRYTFHNYSWYMLPFLLWRFFFHLQPHWKDI